MAEVVVAEPASSTLLFGIPFPRLTWPAALDDLVDGLGTRRAVAFPDMSTLNIARQRPGFAALLRDRFTTFNDGAGLALAARLRRQPLPANLNGTELIPALLDRAEAGTRVFLLGARPEVVTRARDVLAERYPDADFVGVHDGYFGAEDEPSVIDAIAAARPDIVLVAMGHPRQVEVIARHLDDARLPRTNWFAVGGLLDYYGGTLERAPAWMIRARLEWLHLMIANPTKIRRYVIGIPRFVVAAAVTELRGHHDRLPEVKGVR